MLARCSYFVALLTIFCSLPNSPLLAQTEVPSPDALLKSASKAAAKGSYQQALTQVRESKAISGGDLSFGVRFIDSVVDIAEMADSRHRVSFLNDAIKTANKLEKSQVCDGKGDAQFAYHYMVAMGKLGNSISEEHPRIASQIFAAQGKVAQNLFTNPGYPKESVGILSLHLMSLAKSAGIKLDEQATLDAIKVSFDKGFNDFESLLEEPIFKKMKSAKVNAAIQQGFLAYKTRLDVWARDAVAKFKPVDFQFDVEAINAGRVRHSDYRGKIAIVDLWATWCAPCREAIPHFVKLDDKFRKENVEVVGIAMDSPEAPHESLNTVRNFVTKNEVGYQVALGNNSVKTQLPPTQKLPTVLFYDAQGKVRYIAEGPHDFYQLEAITNELIRQDSKEATSFQTSDYR